MRDVQLNPGIPGGKWARLRPLCGRDETLLDSSQGTDLLAFVDTLLTEASGTSVRPGRAADLAVSDFDRLCASIYMECFGEFIESRVACGECRELFEMRFSLLRLMQDLANRRPEISGPDEQGVFMSTDGRRFRLPTAGERREVSGLGIEAGIAVLVERCVLDPAESTEAIESAMDQVGPVLDRDLDAVCPQCGAAQAVRFDIQAYLLNALSYDKQFLLYEVHRIAMAYRWPHREILDLTRDDRRNLVRLIEAERIKPRRKQSWMDI
jgi:hypothetical protein